MLPLQERLAALDAPRPTRSATPDGLTQRELEVLALVCRGYTDREIGGYLSMAPKTVSTNRAEAAAYAARLGLDGPDAEA